MIVIQAKSKDEKFQLQIDENEPVTLVMATLTVADKLKISEVQSKIMDEKEASDYVKMTKVGLSRLITAVKKENGDQFWSSIEDDSLCAMPESALNALIELNNKVNPIETKSLTDKKKKS